MTDRQLSAQEKGINVEELLCSKCKSDAIELENDPCGCMKWCKKCAMKVASGGKINALMFLLLLVVL